MTNTDLKTKSIPWREHVSNFISSGKTQKEYCKDNDISYTKFKSWRYRFPDEFPVNKNHPRAKNKITANTDVAYRFGKKV